MLPVWPPAAAGASVAYLSALVSTTTAGTDAGVNIDTASGGIAYLLRSGFSDAGAVFGTYSPTDHAWLRISEASGTLTWETSPDGQDWTVRRTASSPAWASNTDLALVCESHRDAGTDNVAEIGGINVSPVRTTAGAGAVQATAGAAVSSVRTVAGAAGVSTTASGAVTTVRTATGAALTVVGTSSSVATVRIGAGTGIAAAGAASAVSTARATAGAGQALAGASAVTAQGTAATTMRPYSGITEWTGSGMTSRPYSGITVRP